MTIRPSSLDHSRALAIVPARAGSKGVPGKNLRSLAGRPLLAHAIEAGLGAARVGRVVVSTDSDEIAAVARARGAEVPFLRPAHLAADTSRVADALVDLLERLDGAPESFVLLQPTSPLRTAGDVDAALALLDETGADSVVGVCETGHLLFYERDGRLELAGDAAGLTATNRQELPPAYRLNGAVYAARTASFLERRSLLTGHVVPYPMPRWRSVDIDELEDFAAAELLMRAA